MSKDLIEQLQTMTEYLQEVHQYEIDNDHDGDGRDGCSYCDAIERSKKLLKELEEDEEVEIEQTPRQPAESKR